MVTLRSTTIDASSQATTQATEGTISQSSQTRSGKKRFNYLENTVIYYDFNRNFGVELAEWANPRPAVPKKIKVKDFYHFRNWYLKQTSNGEYPGIVTNMYRIDENGNKRRRKATKAKAGRQRQSRKDGENSNFRSVKGGQISRRKGKHKRA